jgi:predicted acyl esterase
LQAHAQDQETVSVERDVKIPMRDGINLGATVFRPKVIPKPLPVIFCFSPYGTDSPGCRRRGGWDWEDLKMRNLKWITDEQKVKLE